MQEPQRQRQKESGWEEQGGAWALGLDEIPRPEESKGSVQ